MSATGMRGVKSVPASKNLPGKSQRAGRPTAASPKRVPTGRAAAGPTKALGAEKPRGSGIGRRVPLHKAQATKTLRADRTRG